MNKKHYILLADALRYPSEGYVSVVENCKALLDVKYPEAAATFAPFVEYVKTHTLLEIQELYTKTFDVQPICYLDLGYVLFGEDYKRGAFLLHMQDEQIKAQNNCGTDLADNICNVFTLIEKTNNESFLNELAFKILVPALERMIGEFKSARVDLKMKILKKLQRAVIQEELNHGNVYRNCLEAILFVVKHDFNCHEADPIQEALQTSEHHNAFFSKNSISKKVNELVNHNKTT